MHPDAVHDAEREHDHQHERAAVADERQGDAGDRQDRDGHADVLENVRENQRDEPHADQHAEIVRRFVSDEQAAEVVEYLVKIRGADEAKRGDEVDEQEVVGLVDYIDHYREQHDPPERAQK